MTDLPDMNDSRELPALRRALRDLDEPTFETPAEVDRTILARAERRFAQRRLVRRVTWALTGVGAAAAVVAAVILTQPTPPEPSSLAPAAAAQAPKVREDVNADGRVDIRDAFQLARQVRAGAALSGDFDLNRDGVVNQGDVDVIAYAAVKLDQGVVQ